MWVEGALERGDKVVATSRNIDSLKDLKVKYGDNFLALKLDITNRDEVFEIVKQATDYFGRLDVILNNAGYGLMGAIEEFSENEIKSQIDVNFLGSLWVIQAVLPILRKQKSGHIINISSVGVIFNFPIGGIYHATKTALETVTETLVKEVSHLGINSTAVELGGFASNFGGNVNFPSNKLEEYSVLHKEVQEMFSNFESKQMKEALKPMLELVDNATPPKVMIVGLESKDLEGAPALKTRFDAWDELLKRIND